MSGQLLSAKRELLQVRKQVLEGLHYLHERIHAEIDIEPDEGDEEIVEIEKDALVTAILARKLQAIDAALRSIDEGRYSICRRCGQPIGLERLQAKPDATHCVQCQRELERVNRHRQLVYQVQW